MGSEDDEIKTIHVFVALCDNKYQGITRVSAALGNGQNPNTNLYWGARYGIRTYFKKSDDWILLTAQKKKGALLESANVNPLVWTTNLMAPEAYTLHDALAGFINGETNEEIRERAATAYAKYQKCSVNAAKGLLVTGW